MKFRSLILCLIGLVGFGGCRMGPSTHEIFVKDMELNKRIWTPNEHMIKNSRRIYDETTYIYIFKDDPKGCTYGFLTNRDGKPEVVQDWIILSGKEFCKRQQGYGF